MSRSRSMTRSAHADVVVVGGGTVGAWTAVLLAESGVRNVVLLEASTLGDGASSRAAGMVRAQGGTATAIRLGLRSQEFYSASGERFPLDCGFRAQGYLMPCFTSAEVQQAARPHRPATQPRARRRVAEQRRPRRTAHRPGPRRHARRLVRSRRRLHRRPAKRVGLHRRPHRTWRRRQGALCLHRPAHPWRPRHRCRHVGRTDRHRPRGAHRWAATRRRRQSRGCPHPGRAAPATRSW